MFTKDLRLRGCHHVSWCRWEQGTLTSLKCVHHVPYSSSSLELFLAFLYQEPPKWKWLRSSNSEEVWYGGLPWWVRQQRIHLQCRRPGFNPGLGRSPGGRHGQITSALTACILGFSLKQTWNVQYSTSEIWKSASCPDLDAIQPSHPLSSPSPSAFSLSHMKAQFIYFSFFLTLCIVFRFNYTLRHFRCTAWWFSYTETRILLLKLFSIIGYYEILTVVPCAIQWTVAYQFTFIRNLAFCSY